jgi:hypothetical protein
MGGFGPACLVAASEMLTGPPGNDRAVFDRYATSRTVKFPTADEGLSHRWCLKDLVIHVPRYWEFWNVRVERAQIRPAKWHMRAAPSVH